MFGVIKKVGRGIKEFMDEKIKTCKEILSSAQNRLIVGFVMVGAGVGFIASAYIRAPKD
ncbi:MAG: GTP-binding protein [Eubacteriales bacterium]|nr:GTP-binding protein [Eubacteriales bacterium]